MQLCCITMGNYQHTYAFRLLVQVILLNIAVALVGIPIVHSLHTHTVVGSQYKADPPETVNDSGNEQSCDLCASYARFVPREANSIPPFDFNAPIILLSAVCIYPPCEQPCEELLQGYTNKGPPADRPTI